MQFYSFFKFTNDALLNRFALDKKTTELWFINYKINKFLDISFN